MTLLLLQIENFVLVAVFFTLIPILIIILLRFCTKQSMRIAQRMFSEALQYENDGLFKKAELIYRSAMEEVNKKKLQSSKLKDKISMKIKLLHTVIEYNGS